MTKIALANFELPADFDASANVQDVHELRREPEPQTAPIAAAAAIAVLLWILAALIFGLFLS